uniref:Aquaporin n=1 Tax=Neogobius melanostomus TaxID=47308 RepID=A0A8C6TH89_9GOBI
MSAPVLSAVGVSVGVVVSVVLLCELLRWFRRFLSGDSGRVLLEGASTLQLCWCALELKLLGERSSDLPLSWRLSLLYAVTACTCRASAGQLLSDWPSGARVSGRLTLRAALGLVSVQLSAALVARALAVLVWSHGWSEVHEQHRRFGYRCFDPLGGTLLEAAANELALSFIVQGVVLHLHKLEPALRVHALSATITAAVYAGGAVSGAVLNPVLAVSLQFPCSGHSLLDYLFVYWLGPILGVASCFLLFQIIVPFLSEKDVHKQKTQ